MMPDIHQEGRAETTEWQPEQKSASNFARKCQQNLRENSRTQRCNLGAIWRSNGNTGSQWSG